MPVLPRSRRAMQERTASVIISPRLPKLARDETREGHPVPTMPDREELETDVLIVGAGVAGLACAIRLAGLLAARPTGSEVARRAGGPPRILVLEKGAYVGAHILSGCVLDPRGLDELLPGWRRQGAPAGQPGAPAGQPGATAGHLAAPVGQPVTGVELALLTPQRQLSIPSALIPEYLRTKDGRLVSLGELAAWLAGQARRLGVDILEGVAAQELLLTGQTVQGVLCGDTGLLRDGTPGPHYAPGAHVRARVTVLAEGVRGNLRRKLIQALRLDAGRRPQTYGLGLKEIWETRAGAFPAGGVLNTLGYPLQRGPGGAFGGGFVYGLDERHVAVGLVVGLDYRDPALDPHGEFQRWKAHPVIRRILEGGQVQMAGAKALPEGGYDAVPRLTAAGALVVGDAAGLLNAARLKGAHLALASGRLAGEALAEALTEGDCSARGLARYEERLRASWVGDELRAYRRWRETYARGLARGAYQDLVRRASGKDRASATEEIRPDYAVLEPLRRRHPRGPPASDAPDGRLTFDKETTVAHAGTLHAEDQPAHLIVPDPRTCGERCAPEFGSPCQRFCPAAVFEWEAAPPGAGRLLIHAANCLHCKTCDIKDPFENLVWMPPEGGGGPKYRGM